MVHRNKRGLSRLEFYHNARRLRKEITLLTLRDFGIHSRGKRFKEETGSQQLEGYYDELIEKFTKRIWKLLDKLMDKISDGNEYPTNKKELALRRKKQNAAIKACKKLLQQILYCEDVMPVKASVFIPYIERIEYEIKLLKGWRKSNSKIAERIEAAKKKKASGGEAEEEKEE